MPANPTHIKRREVISGEYVENKITVDFYTNNAIAIYRGDEDVPDSRIWLDNLEKRELLTLMKEEV
jgi:hypothetical protein